MARTDIFVERQPSDFQGAWFLLNTSSVSLLGGTAEFGKNRTLS